MHTNEKEDRKNSKVAPYQTCNFLVNLNCDSYSQWNPKHHKEFKALSNQEDTMVGTVYYFKEEFENGHAVSYNHVMIYKFLLG